MSALVQLYLQSTVLNGNDSVVTNNQSENRQTSNNKQHKSQEFA